MRYNFKLKEDLYKEDKQGKPICVKKGVITERNFDTNHIIGVGKVFSKNGKEMKKRCSIEFLENKIIIVEHKYEEIIKLIEPIKIKGFKK